MWGPEDVNSVHIAYGGIHQKADALFQSYMTAYVGTQSHSAYFNLQKATGTRAAPGEVAAGDNLGYIAWKGYKDSSFRYAFTQTVDVTAVGTNYVNGTWKMASQNAGSSVACASCTSAGAWMWGPAASPTIAHVINGHSLQFPTVTTTERDATTNKVGMVVWNTTTSKLEVCTVAGTPGGTWVALH